MTYLHKGASISNCGRYRYRLWREWRGTGTDKTWAWLKGEDGKVAVDGAGAPLGEPKSALFIMLNPSTADGDQDDPTIRRCVGFAKAWGYDRMEVVNLFAWRATKPADLLAVNHPDDPVGENNREHIRRAAAGAGIIVCAWGAQGGHLGQDETTLGWLSDAQLRRCHALKTTKEGYPGHPLYIAASTVPVPFEKATPYKMRPEMVP